MCRILWYRKTLSGSSGLTKGYTCFVNTLTNLGTNVAAKIMAIRSPVFPNDFIRGILTNHCLFYNTDFTLLKRKEPVPFGKDFDNSCLPRFFGGNDLLSFFAFSLVFFTFDF